LSDRRKRAFLVRTRDNLLVLDPEPIWLAATISTIQRSEPTTLSACANEHRGAHLPSRGMTTMYTKGAAQIGEDQGVAAIL